LVDSEVTGKIRFTMPLIKNGDYSITCVVGSYIDMINKVKYHQVYDCIILKVFNDMKIMNNESLIIIDEIALSGFEHE